MLFGKLHAASPLPCTTPNTASTGNLCIIELQTKGADGAEDEDFVIIANPTSFSITLSSVQLQYLNSNGVVDASISAGSGSMAPGQVKTYVSDSLTLLNPSASKLSSSTAKLSLASGGGTFQIAKVLSSGTTIYDKVGWGSALANEKLPAPAQNIGATLVRRQIGGVFQDADDNSTDILNQAIGCRGALINEIQPFVTDEAGNSIDAWIELVGNTAVSGDCSLITGSGDMYALAAADLPLNNGDMTVINRGLDGLGQVVPLHIGDATGQVWLAGNSFFGGPSTVRLPYTTQKYTSMVKGQSWALVDTIWRRTYTPTPESANIYTPDAPITELNPTACQDVRISELFPNPPGDESGNEWLEVHNEGSDVAFLGTCTIDIAGTTYNFLPDDVLAADEWRAVESLYSSDGDTKTITLRNSGDTQVVLSRNTDHVVIQSFVYTDAPEGQSYARFDDGWTWTYTLTPNAANILETSLPTPTVTEYPLSTTSGGGSDIGEVLDTSGGQAQLAITEILPNPALPASDENDEFVELYNAGAETVSLSGYKLETGLDYSHSVSLGNQSIDPGAYYVITSGASSLSLTNSGGRVRLVDATGTVVSETDAYGEATEGESWALINSTWQWTAKPTPSVTNIYAAPIIIPGKSTTTTKKASTKVAAAPKVKAATTAKTASAKKTTLAKDSKSNSSGTSADSGGSKKPIHTAVIAGIGSLAVLYGAYEYRGDISNSIYKFKRDRANRRANRS